MVTVLVIGGAGFVGSNMVRGAIKRGFKVRVLDDLSLGSLRNLAGLRDIEFTKGDVISEETVEKVTRGVDYIFHEAAASSSQMFVPDPRKGMDINLAGFLNVLHYASENCVKKVVYALTSSAYGNSPVPWKEDHLSLEKCPNVYAFSLLARAFFGKLYSESYGLDTLGLIYFSVYGPHERAKGQFANVISQFLWSMMRNEPPVLYGNGNQSRDFIHVDDVVEANFLAIEAKASGQVINIGTGVETTMNEIVDLLKKFLSKKTEPVYAPNPIVGYCYRTLADVYKADRVLRFKAKISIEEGIRLLVDFYRDKSGQAITACDKERD